MIRPTVSSTIRALLCGACAVLVCCKDCDQSDTDGAVDAQADPVVSADAAAGDGKPWSAPPPPPPQGMRAALDAFDEGRFEEAIGRLEKLEGKADPIEDYRLYYLAEALLLDGKPERSMGVYDELARHKKSRFVSLVAFRKADALLEAGRHAEAAKTYASLAAKGIPSTIDSASVHMNWAVAMELDGRDEAAIKRYEHVMRQFPHRPQADQAIEALERLAENYRLDADDRIHRAERLMDLKRFDRAEVELRAIDEKLSKVEARQVAFKLATCVYSKRRAWAEAQQLYTPLSKGTDAIASESTYMIARCLHKRGQQAKAVTAYRKFLDRFNSSGLRDDALMNLMVIDYEAGRFKSVRKNYQPLLERGLWSGNNRSRALWMIAFSAYLEKNHTVALELLDSYEAQATKAMSRARALYWGAVIRQDMGKTDAAVERYTKLAKRYPLHYYALLAMRRLADMGQPVPDPVAIIGPPPPSPGSGCSGLPPVVAVLIELGMDYDARQEMKRVSSKVAKAHSSSATELERVFTCAGAQKLLIRHAGSVYGEESEGSSITTHARWKLLYPTPYRDLVEAHAPEAGVPPMLAMAIIRQESMFDPDVTSQVLASGLMQLMPATARQVAREMDVPYEEARLFDAQTNITFGTHYLGGLVRRFPGNLPAAVGAYNGGPHNVKRWLESHAPVAGDVFVELVPFTQTRNYIRRVLTSFARYTFLTTGEYEPALEWVPRKVILQIGAGPEY